VDTAEGVWVREEGVGGEGEGGQGGEDEWDEEEDEERTLQAPLGKQLRDLYVLGPELGRGHFGWCAAAGASTQGRLWPSKAFAKGKLRVLLCMFGSGTE